VTTIEANTLTIPNFFEF